jgi:hypothetical protein
LSCSGCKEKRREIMLTFRDVATALMFGVLAASIAYAAGNTQSPATPSTDPMMPATPAEQITPADPQGQGGLPPSAAKPSDRIKVPAQPSAKTHGKKHMHSDRMHSDEGADSASSADTPKP